MLHIEQVGFCYPGAAAPALAGISLDIPGETIYGLLGPNGAGKSTLISLLAGLSTAQSGLLRWQDQPLAALRRQHPHWVALVPQEPAFYPMLTVAENLRCFAGILGLAGPRLSERCQAVTAFAQLENVLGQRAETLSGGLRRRLNLAIGLLGEPRLLLLDEPTVGVDPQSRNFLLDAIAALPAQGTTVIYTSHYMEEVQRLCPRLAILDQGRVLAEGSLDSLCATAESPLRLDTDPALPDTLIQRWALHVLAPGKYRLDNSSTAHVAELLGAVSAVPARVTHLHWGSATLDDVFLRLTRRSLRD